MRHPPAHRMLRPANDTPATTEPRRPHATLLLRATFRSELRAGLSQCAPVALRDPRCEASAGRREPGGELRVERGNLLAELEDLIEAARERAVRSRIRKRARTPSSSSRVNFWPQRRHGTQPDA